MIVVQLVTSFVASSTFCILFNAPRRALLQCGLSGMVGWIVYIMLNGQWGPVPATFAATVLVGIVSLMFARTFKLPVIIFSVGGIIPLVPGGLAYNAMRKFVEDDYIRAVEIGTEALLLSGAIAAGLVLSEVLGQMFRKRA